MRNFRKLLLLTFLPYLGYSQSIFLTPEVSPQLQFAKAEIKPYAAKYAINIICDKDAVGKICKDEGFQKPLYEGKQRYAIRRKGTKIWVLADNTLGGMYGGLDIADALRLGHAEWIVNKDQKPYLEERGIKFNISLDLRTPSYNESGDAAQANIPEMWKEEFWQEYFDEMARNRMNTLTLWSLNIFPSMVYIPEFPEVGLNDVWRTKEKYEDGYSMNGLNYDRPHLFENVEIVKKITIQEKMDFWRKVMQMADDRGIATYVFHWNMFTYGAEGKHGITREQDNEQTIAYFKAATREMIKQYPLLKGIGITAGEGMEKNRKDEYENEKWLWRTYGEGINEGLKDTPNRDFRLIHRFHMTALDNILENFNGLNCRMDVSLKYAIAHMYSIPNPPFVKDAFPMLSQKHKTWLTIRNDDIYSMRWANYDFAKKFIDAIPNIDLVAGFYMGPDGYTWGRDYLNKNTLNNPPLVIKKQWVSNRMWGLLSFDPTLPKKVFDTMVEKEFAGNQTSKLMPAWEAASMIFPYITRFLWGDIDLKWFPEANFSTKGYRGFYTVEEYIKRQPMPGANISGIAQWFHSAAASEGLTSPMVIADSLALLSNTALNGLKKMTTYKATSTDELQSTQSDIAAFAHIGLYYSCKIKAAFALAEFDKTNNEQLRVSSLAWLKKAELHWNDYAKEYSQKNLPALYNRVGYVDVNKLKVEVAKDYDIVKNWKPNTIEYKPATTTEKVFRK